MKRSEGIAVARAFREAMLARGYPVQRVVLFGSVARDQATEDSDLDIAVICRPFAETRHEENLALRRLCWDVDIRIEPISLHPDDFTQTGFPLAGEIERTGIEV
jgi:predicted nucleotidyltransferase